MWHAANTSWFNFTAPAATPAVAGLGGFGVYAFSGVEEICKPYEFSIELVSRSANVDAAALLGTPACLSIADKSGGTRLVHGLIRELEQLHTGNKFTHYRAVVVPRLWFLSQITDHRIFQNLTVAEIIPQILQEQGFTAEEFSFNAGQKFQPREYCVQYGETYLHFISRLCEEEGIFFYHTHSANGHCLCFYDYKGGPAIDGEAQVRFNPGSGQISDYAVISKLNLRQAVNSNSAMYKEWNFTIPMANLTVTDLEPDAKIAPVPAGMKLEQYKYPHIYGKSDPGNRYVRLQVERQLTFSRWIEAESDVARFLPGHVFSITWHPRGDVNAEWFITATRHHGEQPGVLEHEAPSSEPGAGRGLRYSSQIQAIPQSARYVPQWEHPKRREDGLQSAIVTGPSGEEVYTDEYGRVKVQFHWDRLGQRDENTTCWVRVADSWAGPNFGFIQIPRIGQEVMVEFMEGDPDRPVITGRVYNQVHMPPWQLPEQKTLSGIQSREFKGGQRNQLVLDDTQGQVQAQLSSDHGLSQLNLGYITRVNHRTGREDFRGEGFELRTDGWGVLRAAKGLYLSTHTRNRAIEHQKEMREAVDGLQRSLEQHEAQGKFAVDHKAQSDVEDLKKIVESLQAQLDEIKGGGKTHGELITPQMVLSSSSGCAINAENTLQLRGGEHTALTSGGHTSMASGANFLATALGKISLFAHRLGIKMFAAQGKVEIQAQSDAIDVIAEQVLTLISAKKSVEIAAAEEIKLSCGGSYIKINSSGIEQGTSGEWVAHAANHKFSGPRQEKVTLPDFNAPGNNWMGLAVFGDNLQPIEDIEIKYTATFLDGTQKQGTLDASGRAMLENVPPGQATVIYEFPPPVEKERETMDALLPLFYELTGEL